MKTSTTNPHNHTGEPSRQDIYTRVTGRIIADLERVQAAGHCTVIDARNGNLDVPCRRMPRGIGNRIRTVHPLLVLREVDVDKLPRAVAETNRAF